MSFNPPPHSLDLDLALLRLRRDAADRWLLCHRRAASRDARHLAALSQAIRHLASLRLRQGDDGPSELQRLLAEAARRVREHALEKGATENTNARE